MNATQRVAARYLNAYGGSHDWAPPGASTAFWHGTPLDFESLRLGPDKILWLTDNRTVAATYARKHWYKNPEVQLWEIYLQPKSRIISLRDLNNPIIRQLKEQVSGIRKFTWGEITDESWPDFADFGILEGYSWVRPWLKQKRVDGIWVADSNAGIGHMSIALLNIKAIARSTKHTELK